MEKSTTELSIGGMTCGNCARHVTEALRETPGVASATVDLEKNHAVVRWRGGAGEDVDSLVEAVKKAGYEAELAKENEATKRGPLRGWQFNVALGSIATIPMIISEWAFGLGMERWYHWLAFALATPVQFVAGARFYRGAWRQAKSGGSNMDTLVALGSTTAYLFSVVQLLRGAHGHVYFMDSAAIITLISVGHWLETKVSARAEHALRSLLDLAPDTARRVRDGVEEEVAVNQLRPDDAINLRPGDHVPTDGMVIEGRAAVDESMLTGESLPVDKEAGSKVFAGSVNHDGRMTVRVTALGEETALAKIIEVVRRAQSSRAKIQELGDRVSSIFVPIVIGIAAATAAWWFLAPDHARATANFLSAYLWHPHLEGGRAAGAVFHAAAVLIIACPCAMGLATPVAIMAGANVAAKRGILIRDGRALEKSGTISTILFDKTGTLTEGKLKLVAFEDFGAVPQARELAGALAFPSRHPLSRAIATEEAGNLENWREIRGSGISATHEGQPVRLGSVKWNQSEGVDSADAKEFIQKWAGQGASVLLLSVGTRLAAAIALMDSVKPNARDVVESLRAQGKEVTMVTGDLRVTAISIGRKLGLGEESVFAEVAPEKKAEIIQGLQAKGKRVAFVGDGINDAPALAIADLGIALGSGADAARQAADVVLLRAGLEAVPEALGIAKATLRTIKQNLFWAFFYNAAGVPLAAFGFFSPMLSAAAMGVSDLIVIGNALRLKRSKRGSAASASTDR